jgi:molybdenum cofactor synthesis domain-containing protein
MSVAMSEPAKIVTACIVVIGNEILSGRTRDSNIQYLATELGQLGVQVRECRVIPDIETTIVATINEVRRKFDYVFTTGGIGPTHDDITADSIAKAFGVGIDVDERARAMMLERFRPEDLNEARLRMARIPHGADLVDNPISRAPGFKIGNVVVMAGVPAIMQRMLDNIVPTLASGTPIVSETISPGPGIGEGMIATPLGVIAREHPRVSIGSYPSFGPGGFETHLIIRGKDPDAVATAKVAVELMVRHVQEEKQMKNGQT